MASTYTSRLRLVRPTTGELTNTWGNVFNQQFSDLIDVAIAGFTTVAMTDANKTLTASNGTADQSRAAMLKITGTLTANRNVYVPQTSKTYCVENATTGGFMIYLRTTAATGVDIPNGARVFARCDGTNVTHAITELPSGATVDGTTIGYLGVPQVIKDSNYTLVLSDAGKHIYHTTLDSVSRTWTIPSNASVPFPIGTTITFINDVGSGGAVLTIVNDTLIFASTGATGSRVLAQPSMATAVKVSATRWVLNGTGVS
jgi:hypothetical protein